MNRLSPRVLSVTLLFGLSVALGVGCQKNDDPSPEVKKSDPNVKRPNRDVKRGDPNVKQGGPKDENVNQVGNERSPWEKIRGIPKNEDPEVVALVKAKGWMMLTDVRITDYRPLVSLLIENKTKQFQDFPLTPEEYKTIAKSKTLQFIDLRWVKLTDEGLKTLAGIPTLEMILVKGDDVTDAGIKELARCRNLDTVSLMFTKKVTDAGVKELATLPKLQGLYLMGLTMDGSAFAAFVGSKTLETVKLEMVDGLTDEGVKHLAKLPRLNELKLGTGYGEQKVTAAGIKAVVDARLPAKFEFNKKLLDDGLLEALVAKGWLYGPSPPGTKERDKRPATAAQVQFIDLSDSKVTDKGMQAVLNCTNATDLFLTRTGVSDATLKQLAAFKKLKYLALDETKVAGPGLETLTGLPIKHVSLQRCDLTEDAFKALGKMNSLEELWLSDTKLQPDWLKHLAHLPQLKELTLMGTSFNDDAVKLVKSLPKLETLALNNTKLGDKGFRELIALPQLQSLNVDGTQVTREVYQKAKKDRPKLRLYFYRYDQ